MRNLLWRKQLHARVPSMISFYSHRDVWVRQVGEKEEGGSVCVCVWEDDIAGLKRELNGFKYKTNSLSSAAVKQNSSHWTTEVKISNNSNCKVNVIDEFTTCQTAGVYCPLMYEFVGVFFNSTWLWLLDVQGGRWKGVLWFLKPFNIPCHLERKSFHTLLKSANIVFFFAFIYLLLLSSQMFVYFDGNQHIYFFPFVVTSEVRKHKVALSHPRELFWFSAPTGTTAETCEFSCLQPQHIP